MKFGVVAQLARALPCHGRGRGFESLPPRQVSKMNTEILPGFSLKNKDWAEGLQQFLSKYFSISVVYWPHWETEAAQKNWKEIQARNIAQKYKGTELNVIAKSIGTLVLMTSLKEYDLKINKIILCGIPLNDLDENDKKYYEILKNISPESILIFQNETDNHGSFNQVRDFIGKIHPQIKLVNKPRNDHEYPYDEDFLEFLK